MSENTNSEHTWPQEALEKLLFATLKEQRSSRRWKIFFRLLVLFFFLFFLFILFASPSTSSKPHTALINIKGVIMEDAKASAENIIKGLNDAFEDDKTKGVLLYINSPGGSPVQSSQVYDTIMMLKKEHPKVKVYAVCNDVCASGSYYIAAAADEIYANKSSIVGSIGVRLASFGFVDAMEKVGVTRRLFTAGSDKGYLDPFLPLKENEVTHTDEMLENVHQQFINDVKQGRGDRLVNNPEIFSGLIWNGDQAKQLGLIDGFGDYRYVAKNVIEAEEVEDYTYYSDLFQRIAENMGSEFDQKLASFFGMRLT